MIRLNKIKSYPASKAIYSDRIIEFHASRLLLLFMYCGVKERGKNEYRIDGLTKLAKLDFFVRYPRFFETVANHLNKPVQVNRIDIESKMIKFHYGPWDERYYQLLPYLEARQLISISQDKNTYYLRLTEKGVNATKIFSDYDEFSNLIQDMKVVKSVLGSYSGTKLKNLIYKIFGDEVAIKKLKESINYE